MYICLALFLYINDVCARAHKNVYVLVLHFETYIGETGVGWDKFWLGECPSVLNESLHCDTNYVFGEHFTTAFTGATHIIDARFSSEISKITF